MIEKVNLIKKEFEEVSEGINDLKTLNDILMSERSICVNLTTGTVNEIIK